MLEKLSINITKSNQDNKILLRDSDLNTLSILRKFKIDASLIFLKKGDVFELIRLDGIAIDLANSFLPDKKSIVYTLLKSTDSVITQKEVLSSCKESVFFHKELGPRLRQEIEYWEKLGLENYYPVRDKVHGLMGFVVFSFVNKHFNKHKLRKFKGYIEDNIRYTYEGEKDKVKDKELLLYKGLYELQKDLLCLEDKDKEQRIFSYFQDVLVSISAVMYILQDKCYIPHKFKNVTFIKPLLKDDVHNKQKIFSINIISGSFLFEEMGAGEVVVIKLSKKVLFVFKVENDVCDLDFVNNLVEIVGKFLND